MKRPAAYCTILCSIIQKKPAAQAAGADHARCNTISRQNPPIQQNHCNFWTNTAIVMQLGLLITVHYISPEVVSLRAVLLPTLKSSFSISLWNTLIFYCAVLWFHCFTIQPSHNTLHSHHITFYTSHITHHSWYLLGSLEFNMAFTLHITRHTPCSTHHLGNIKHVTFLETSKWGS